MVDLSRNIDRFEANDLRMFNYVDQASIPSSVSFKLYDPLGDEVMPRPTVVISGGDITKGMYFTFVQLPNSRGFYTYEWQAVGSGTIQSSMYVTVRGTFEIAKTEPVSFFSYGSKANVMRVARQLIGRGDLTEYDVMPHMLAAFSYINGRLGNIVTTLPFSPASPYIKQGEEVLAVYTLYGTFGATEKDEIPPAFTKMRDDFLAYLDAVIAGEIAIDGTIIGTPGKVSFITGGLEDSRVSPIFGLRGFENQRIDWDILEWEAGR